MARYFHTLIALRCHDVTIFNIDSILLTILFANFPINNYVLVKFYARIFILNSQNTATSKIKQEKFYILIKD